MDFCVINKVKWYIEIRSYIFKIRGSVCVCCVCFLMDTVVTMLVWESEDNFQELILAFYHVGPKDVIQIVRLGDKLLPPGSHHTQP